MKLLHYGGIRIEQCEYTGRCYISDFRRWFNSLRSAKHSITRRKVKHGRQTLALE